MLRIFNFKLIYNNIQLHRCSFNVNQVRTFKLKHRKSKLPVPIDYQDEKGKFSHKVYTELRNKYLNHLRSPLPLYKRIKAQALTVKLMKEEPDVQLTNIWVPKHCLDVLDISVKPDAPYFRSWGAKNIETWYNSYYTSDPEYFKLKKSPHYIKTVMLKRYMAIKKKKIKKIRQKINTDPAFKEKYDKIYSKWFDPYASKKKRIQRKKALQCNKSKESE